MKRDYKIDVYDSILRVCNDRKSAHLTEDDKNHASSTMYAFNGKWWIIIYLPKPCLRTACHESLHGAIDLLSELGYKLDRDNQEPLAWLTDYIFSKCQDFIERLPADA